MRQSARLIITARSPTDITYITRVQREMVISVRERPARQIVEERAKVGEIDENDQARATLHNVRRSQATVKMPFTVSSVSSKQPRASQRGFRIDAPFSPPIDHYAFITLAFLVILADANSTAQRRDLLPPRFMVLTWFERSQLLSQ